MFGCDLKLWSCFLKNEKSSKIYAFFFKIIYSKVIITKKIDILGQDFIWNFHSMKKKMAKGPQKDNNP